jgi:hypothetical protein
MFPSNTTELIISIAALVMREVHIHVSSGSSVQILGCVSCFVTDQLAVNSPGLLIKDSSNSVTFILV